MEPGLRIAISPYDDDLYWLEIGGSNGAFAGSTFVYADDKEIARFAAYLDGFPQTPSDERSYEFGVLDPAYAGGYAKLHFRCVDSKGHSVMETDLVGDTHPQIPTRAHFTVRVEAAGVDAFVSRLNEISSTNDGDAFLAAAVD